MLRLRMAVLSLCLLLCSGPALRAEPPELSTFSIVAADPEAGEVGVAVASRFFAVGAVVPWAEAGVGAVATQSFANTTFGPRGLQLLEHRLTPEEVLEVLLRHDEDRDRRQVGVVSADGAAATYTGDSCIGWAGGRQGPSYVVQGNILTGDKVVAAMEQGYQAAVGKPLAVRLYDALKAGDQAGGDSRGKQSAALIVYRKKGGYGGFNDRAIDIRVDDHAEPMAELRRLLDLALVWDGWNQGWRAFREERLTEALAYQERTAALAEETPEMLSGVLYDLGVIRLANGDSEGALAALRRAIALEPKLAEQARGDEDLAALHPYLEEELAPQP